MQRVRSATDSRLTSHHYRTDSKYLHTYWSSRWPMSIILSISVKQEDAKSGRWVLRLIQGMTTPTHRHNMHIDHCGPCQRQLSTSVTKMKQDVSNKMQRVGGDVCDWFKAYQSQSSDGLKVLITLTHVNIYDQRSITRRCKEWEVRSATDSRPGFLLPPPLTAAAAAALSRPSLEKCCIAM